MPVKSRADILDEINELSRYEKTAIFNALKDNLYPSSQAIGQVVEELRETKFSSGLVCPHCNDNFVVKNGKFNGRQRYLCRSCKHTFNDFTNTPMQRTQMPEKWLQYLELMFKGFSLRAAAVEIGGVTHVTLFYWRHKILNALKHLDVDSFEGITEMDETYFLYSEKGHKSITWREPRHRGGKAKKRGISKEQVGVLVVCDRHKQSSLRVAGSGRINAETLNAMVTDKISNSATLCSDADTAIKSFATEHNLKHIELNASKGQRVKQGVYHIQNVNACHKQLKDWMRKFNGVATKYLDNYLSWYRFVTATKFEAMAAKRNQMLIAASQFNVVSTCRSLRLSRWDHATS